MPGQPRHVFALVEQAARPACACQGAGLADLILLGDAMHGEQFHLAQVRYRALVIQQRFAIARQLAFQASHQRRRGKIYLLADIGIGAALLIGRPQRQVAVPKRPAVGRAHAGIVGELGKAVIRKLQRRAIGKEAQARAIAVLILRTDVPAPIGRKFD